MNHRSETSEKKTGWKRCSTTDVTDGHGWERAMLEVIRVIRVIRGSFFSPSSRRCISQAPQFVCGLIAHLICLSCLVDAQENPPAPAAVEGVKGVKQEAVQKIKNVEAGTVNTAKDVNKVDGVDTINGVKAEGHAVIPPIQHLPPPPVAGTAATIHAVQGVAGINAAKLQNLEAALKLKQEGTGTPTAKGKAAAAALGGVGPGVKPGPKPDGRDAFQEFQKLQTNGS